MRAMVLERQREPLRLVELPDPEPGPGQVLLSVAACGVCRTDLHIVDGELSEPKLPLVLGHQIVGTVAGAGEGAGRFAPGERVGVPWLGWTDGTCRYCAGGRENLCDRARFTGYDIDGGYAELAVADERFCFPIPDGYPDEQAAPLLCAGLIGYRALRLVGDAERIGFYGFGASAHILCQVAVHQGRRVFVFTREGDAEGQQFARGLGAEWAGASGEAPPEELDGGDRLRAGRLADDRGAAGQRQGRADNQRRHPHERHPVLPLRAAMGRAQPGLGRQPDARATARSSWSWRRGCPCGPRWRSIRWKTPTRRSTRSATAACEARLCCAYEVGVTGVAPLETPTASLHRDDPRHPNGSGRPDALSGIDPRLGGGAGPRRRGRPRR